MVTIREKWKRESGLMKGVRAMFRFLTKVLLR